MSSPLYSIEQPQPASDERISQLIPVPIPPPEPPGIASVFYVLGGLQVLGGLALCYYFWPGQADVGYAWLPAKYLASVTWLVSGIVGGSLFIAIAQLLTFIKGIYENTYRQKV